MADPIEALREVELMLANLKYVGAHDKVLALIRTLPEKELGLWVPELRRVVDRFLPTRRIRLEEALAVRLKTPAPPAPEPTPLEPTPASVSEVVTLQEEVRSQLSLLSDRHIFQWSTAYRDAIGQIFLRVQEFIRLSTTPAEVPAVTTDEFARHAAEIWSKGFSYLTISGRFNRSETISKSLSGLQRFLELPVEAYSASAPRAKNVSEARAIKAACSSILTGILEGYGTDYFGDSSGWELLAQYPRVWAHYLPFLTYGDLDRVRQQLPNGRLRRGLDAAVGPLIRSLDDVLSRGREDFFCLPSFGQFAQEGNRLDISVPLPKSVTARKYLELQCFLSEEAASRVQLEESSRRGVVLIVAPVGTDLSDWVKAHPQLRVTVVDTANPTAYSMQAVVQKATDIISTEAARYSGRQLNSGPLTYNFAQEFPLQSPSVNRFFLVHRESVRRLLRTFERRNGVRLWCSVRRSGKTTACFDLGADTASDVVIQQTCDSTEQYPGANVFYDAFEDALSGNRRIPNNFFSEAVSKSSGAAVEGQGRTVFVLDEYETLFERMRYAMKVDPGLRYTVVQPLLNQMVAFSRQNLLIFIGQRPDAYCVIMDQNQLSPYVQQDLFPLFEHRAGSLLSEFRSLLQKVLTDRVTFDPGFIDSVFAETAGHPFLTVNLMVHFFDWMIAMKRPATKLALTTADFSAFSAACLTPEIIGIRPEYTFFLRVAGEALSADGKRQTPWLHAVYSILRRICEGDPKNLECSTEKFGKIVNDLRLTDEFGYHPQELIRTAALANFLQTRDTRISPRIRLMARITLAARPTINW